MNRRRIAAPISLLLCIFSIGCASDDASNPSVRVISDSREGSVLTLTLESNVRLYDVWALHCSTAPKLLKNAGGTWVPLQDDRPRPGSGQRFYLDGTIDGQCSLGCDGGDSCYEGGISIALSTLEYVQTGLKPATSTQCFSDPTAAAGDIPDIVSRDTEGPYQLELTYMANACDFSKQQVVHLPVP